MSLTLRPYQEQLKAEIIGLIRQGHKRILCVLPTGGGKTTIFGDLVAGAASKQSEALVVAHRKELITQAWERLCLFKVAAGRIMGGKHKYKGDRINVASIQTLVRREMPAAKVIIIDECHRATLKNQYAKLLEEYPEAIILGFTATPIRLDGKPLGDFFQAMALGVSVLELIGMGYLVPCRYFRAHENINTSGVGIDAKNKDFNTAQLYAAADKPTLYQGVILNWRRHAQGKKTVCFCVNVQHSQKTAAEFNAAGIPAAHLDAETNDTERDQILADFAKGKYLVLCNVGILTEGWDLPAIGCVILNRATASLGLFMQAVGRGLRPAPRKSFCVVLDMGGNTERHGFAEDERPWELNPKKKKKTGTAPVKVCKFVLPEGVANYAGEECNALNHTTAKFCIECGHPFPEPKKEAPKVVELVEVFPAHLKGVKWEQLGTVALIEEFRVASGYKLGWAVHRLHFLAESQERDPEEVFTEYATLRGFKPGWVYQQLVAVG